MKTVLALHHCRNIDSKAIFQIGCSFMKKYDTITHIGFENKIQPLDVEFSLEGKENFTLYSFSKEKKPRNTDFDSCLLVAGQINSIFVCIEKNSLANQIADLEFLSGVLNPYYCYSFDRETKYAPIMYALGGCYMPCPESEVNPVIQRKISKWGCELAEGKILQRQMIRDVFPVNLIHAEYMNVKMRNLFANAMLSGSTSVQGNYILWVPNDFHNKNKTKTKQDARHSVHILACIAALPGKYPPHEPIPNP